MASGHGVDKPDKGEHPNRKVDRYTRMLSQTKNNPADMQWMSEMTEKHGHPGGN